MDEEPEVDPVVLGELIEAAELASHAEALGHVSLAWTTLHEVMGMLFAYLLMPAPQEHAYAVWHSIKNDRTQREMLKALAESALPEDDEIRKAIKWAVDKLLSLENSRNDALHSPYVLFHHPERGPTMISNDLTGNRRAANLAGRDLSVELESYKSNVRAITDYLWAGVVQLSQPQNALAPQPHKMPPPPALPKPAHAMTPKLRQTDE
jgi:hypothetical protein